MPSFNFFKLNLQIKNPKIKIEPKQLVHSVLGGLLVRAIWWFLIFIFLPSFFGFMAGFAANLYFYEDIKPYLDKLPLEFPQISQEKADQEEISSYSPQTSQEQLIIKVVKEASPAVVSIIASADAPVFEQYYVNLFGEEFPLEVPQQLQTGTEKQEISAGTGFIISEDGLILTNKHVVSMEGAEYMVYTNDGKKFPARVLATDPIQDIAVVKIDSPDLLPTLELGNSSQLQIGQSVIAIGNALGEFRNTVSVGVISGLGRTITAEGGGITETIADVIQTDAAINEGNSGGPLLNLRGEVVGINIAIASGAQNIGFALPVDRAKRDVEQVKSEGKISYPYLGIYYTIITPNLKKQYNLPVDYGAWLGRNAGGQATNKAVLPDTAAAHAGLKADDIILEIDGQKIAQDNSLTKIMQILKPGDAVTLKVLRAGLEITAIAILGVR